LREFLPAWLDMSEDPWVHSVVRQGFRIQFSERFPPLLAKPVYQSQYTDKIRRLALDQVIIDYLSKGAISILDYPPGPGFYSRVFLVPKRSGKWRMVIDLSSLNLFTKVEAFKMESVDSIRQSLKIGEWAASIDLSDAYLHVPIHVSSQKFLRFAIGGKVYQCLALPFGLSAAPYVFTRIMKTVAACCHRKGLRYHVYLDDSLCPAVTASACHSQVQQIKTIMENLGFLINIKKSEMIPAQQFTFLGVAFDLRNGLVSPAAHRLLTFQDLLRSLIGQTTATPRKLHRLLGHMESFSRILPGARAAKRELQLRLNQLWDYLHWDQPLSLEKWFLPTIQPWRDQDFLLQKSPLHQPHPTQSLYTDACETGWGAHLETLHVSGKWEPEMTGRHINFLEMEAVNRAVSAFSSQMLNQVTLLRTDNTTVAAYINKEGGGSLTGPMPIISIDTSEGLGITGSLDCPPHTRGIECSGRFSEQTGKNSTHRVDYTSGNTEQYLRDMGQASNRSVCYTSESQTSPVRLASTRPSSMECRRARVRLDGTGRIRLSPTNSPVSGTRENPIRVLLGDSSRPELAGTALVSSTPITTDRSTGKAVTETGSADATPVQTNPSEAGSVQATRLETIQRSLKNRGFSEQASLQLSSVRRLSTEKIYQSHWRSWVDWTNSRQVDPCNPPVNQLTEFLLYLHKEKNLSQGTVKSYRSAICTTIRQSGGPDLASDPILRELVNSLKIIGPKPIPRVPDWDVFIVLEALKSNPFEPPEKCTLENWSYKTAFLMALATAKRRSELHALDYNSIRWAEDSVTLSTLPDFVAKNQRPGETFPIIKVPSLSKTLTKSDTHRRVCPVRALRWYLHKSKDLRTNQRRVFISFSKVGKEIAQATLSRWIVKAISISLKENGNLPCNRATPRAHEVRAVATSLALLRSVSMENILRAAFWRNESTFSRFYLRDMTRSVDGRARLPVVAAQQILY